MGLKREVNQLLLNPLLMTEKLISITYVQSVDFHVLVRSSSPPMLRNFFYCSPCWFWAKRMKTGKHDYFN